MGNQDGEWEEAKNTQEGAYRQQNGRGTSPDGMHRKTSEQDCYSNRGNSLCLCQHVCKTMHLIPNTLEDMLIEDCF